MLSNELIFYMYITGHRRKNPIDFGECRMHSFFLQEFKNELLPITLTETNSLRCSSIQMAHSVELKFDMYTIGHCPTYCVDFEEFRINNSFSRNGKNIIYYSLWSQIIRSMLVSKWCFR